MKISNHFELSEFLISQEATRHRPPIDMAPSQEVKAALSGLAHYVLDPIREHVGRPVVVTSGYRPVALNTLIGGSNTSQHCKGEAADIHVPGMSVYTLCQMVMTSNVPFDQMIYEFGAWCHVSHKLFGEQRRQVLTAIRRRDGHVEYLQGLHKL